MPILNGGGAKRAFRLLPARLRAQPLVVRLKALLQRHLLPHDWTYDEEYYANVGEWARRSAPHIAATIMSDLVPESALDVGCGTGDLLEALRERGCRVQGLEHSDAAIEAVRRRGIPVWKCDLEQALPESSERFDVVVSLEVAEHLPESRAIPFVTLLTRSAPWVVLTAAAPGQGGTDHVNEQPPSYWHAKFSTNGYEYEERMTNRWRTTWEALGGVAPWYSQNLMIFRQRQQEPPRREGGE